MIALALATIGLPPFWRALAASGQVLFYLLAAVDPLVPARYSLKRVTSPVRTFVVLMASSLAAVRVYFVSPAILWKEASDRSAAGHQIPRPSESQEQKVPTSSGI